MKPRRALPATLLTALVVAGVALTACSSEIEGTPRSAGERAPVTEEGDSFSLPGDDDAPFDPELAGRLITLDDLPPGWTEAAPDEEDDDGDDGFDQCVDAVEPPAFLDDVRGEIDGEAEVEFSGPGEVASVSQTLSRMEYAEDTELFLDGLALIFDECSDATFDIDGTPATVSITPVPLSGIGDEARSWRMALDVGGISLEFEFAAFRQDEYVSILFYGDPFGDGGPGMKALARAAVDKLR